MITTNNTSTPTTANIPVPVNDNYATIDTATVKYTDFFTITPSETVMNSVKYALNKNTVMSTSNKFKITKVEMLAKDKVMRFTFLTEDTMTIGSKQDIKVIKTICKSGDTFSIETACYIALVKYLLPGELTPEGISAFAEQLKFFKWANKAVAAAVKLYHRSVKEAEKAAAAEKERKLIKERQRAKKVQYKERRKNRNKN